MERVLRLAGCAGLTALLALWASGCANSAAQRGAGPGSADLPAITAHGVGTVTGAPDQLTLMMGVQTRGTSAASALAANNQQATNLINTLKSRGVADADLRTSQLSVNPTTAADGRITGYEVTNQVTATLRNLASAGSVLDAAAGAAGDAIRVRELTFSIADDSALRARARAEAVHQAQEQAKQLADAAGVRLGALRSITEAPTAPPPTRMYEAPGAVPVQPGSQQLSVAVDLVYDITS